MQYVEPTGTLLGDITTFRKVFCTEDDRTLAEETYATRQITLPKSLKTCRVAMCLGVASQEP